MALRAVLAGPAAARTLRAGGSGRVEVALGAGGYLRIGDDGWILVAGPRATVGPLSLLVAGSDPGPAQQGWPVRVDGERLVVGPHTIDLVGLREARPPAAAAAPGSREDRAAALAAALGAVADPPATLEPGIAALERGDLTQAVDLLAGLGDGLTPAGDDVLAGFAGFAAARGGAANSPTGQLANLSTLAAARTTAISLAYLRCAERGELPEPAAAVLAAIDAGDAAAARRRASVLHKWGSSSGPALLWGIAAAVRLHEVGAADHAIRAGS